MKKRGSNYARNKVVKCEVVYILYARYQASKLVITQNMVPCAWICTDRGQFKKDNELQLSPSLLRFSNKTRI